VGARAALILGAQVLAGLPAALVRADHGAGLRTPRGPLVEALLWGAAVLVLGLAVVAIVSVLTRRGSS
jgi:hypothetical protein